VEGVEVARSRRGRASDRDLARGPGRLTQALGLHPEHKGCDLLGDGPVTLEFPAGEAEMIMVGPRVGVSVEADRPWRFWIGDSRFVSDYKRSPRAAPRMVTGSPIAQRWNDH
jgi:DNA-3-methyladenine glycosylase